MMKIFLLLDDDTAADDDVEDDDVGIGGDGGEDGQ